MDASDYCKFDIDITLRQLQGAPCQIQTPELSADTEHKLKELHKCSMKMTEVDVQEFFNGKIEHFKPESIALLKKEGDTDE